MPISYNLEPAFRRPGQRRRIQFTASYQSTLDAYGEMRIPISPLLWVLAQGSRRRLS